MQQDKVEALFSEAPIPGQSWTSPRRTMPYDRPSDEVSVEDYLDKLFARLSDERVTAQFLSMVEGGIPLDHIVQTLVQSMFGEGKINANMVFLMVPPLTVMLWRMAEAAGISPTLSTDGKSQDVPQMMLHLNKKTGKATDENKVRKAMDALRKSRADAKGMTKKEGLMKRPEAII